MAGPDQQAGNKTQLQEFADRFRALPPRTQYIIMGVFGVFVLLFLLRNGGDDTQTQQPQRQQVQQVSAQGANATRVQDAIAAGQVGSDNDAFSGIEADRPALIQRWMQQQQQTLSDLQEGMEGRFEQMQAENKGDREELGELRTEIRQLIRNFEDQIKTMEEGNRRDREILGKLAEETRKLQLQAPVGGQNGSAQVRNRGRISQTPLAGGGGRSAPQGQPFLGDIGQRISGQGSVPQVSGAEQAEPEPKPFVPPLGFIKGTLLNGVDALAGGGQATPALVRISGVYKTAMNSTVNLNGCFMLVEFEGDISTERALGRPNRMTCVFPDQGAATYSVSGYVVDARDGIIGVPGVFYEGNSTRLAAAMVADFIAGVSEVVNDNQDTTTTNADGVTTNTITGSELRSQISGGAAQAVGSLRDYLFERANRVLPFVRLDATREINIVLLSGVELRDEGKPWTVLFNGGGS